MVRILADDGSRGSGTVVERGEHGRGLVLTANHVVRDANQGQVRFTSGWGESPFRVLARDDVWDLALLDVRVPEGYTVARVAADDGWPRAGEALEICGYGPHGVFLCQSGRAAGYCRAGRADRDQMLAVRPARARPGDSGGPIFNQRGEVVAVLWGSCEGETIGTCCLRIGPLLRRLLAELGRPCTNDEGSKGDDQQQGGPESERDARDESAGASGSAVARLEGELNQLRTQLEALARLPGPAGPAGPAGSQGQDGKPGRDGSDLDEGRLRELLLAMQQAETRLRTLLVEQSRQSRRLDELERGRRDETLVVQGLYERLERVERRMSGKVRFRWKLDPRTGEVVNLAP